MSFVKCEVKKSSSLHLLLCSIALERGREVDEFSTHYLKHEAKVFWTSLFTAHFLDNSATGPDEAKDDMIFFVNHTSNDQNEIKDRVKVFRKESPNLPALSDHTVDWEQSVYLNLIMQQFDYTLTCAVCSRTSERELQILKKVSHRVFASPSRRRMDSKGTHEEITYPNIFFTVDNFEELYSEIIVRDSEMVVVELVASDRHGNIQGTLFMGSIKYDALKRVYDSRASVTSRMARHMNLTMFHGHHQRVEFVRMRGPDNKGYAEMAVSKFHDSTDVMTHSETFDDSLQPISRFSKSNNRRMSDPYNSNAGLHRWMRTQHSPNIYPGHSKLSSGANCSPVSATSAMKKSPSGVDQLCEEIEAGNLSDELNDDTFFGRSFGQAWHWFKERRRATSIAINAYLTYVSLPWQRIITDVVDTRQPPLLTF